VVSRQRYFGTPIPVWECACGEVVPASEEQCYVDPTTDEPPVNPCPKCGGEMIGCQDVFDTWMDSSVSPAYIAFWKRDDAKFERYYPTGLRPQASDIIRTWAFYSLLRSHLLFESRPWRDIMIDGFILSPDGTPMHASLGNAIDPIETLEEYGGDVFRYLSSLCTLGQDSNFRPPDLTRGRRFVEKFWNVQQFIKLALGRSPDGEEPEPTNVLDRWIFDLLGELAEKVKGYYDAFDYSSAMRDVQFFVWHVLADHYIELVKPRVYSGSDKAVFGVLRTLGITTTKLLAPLLPHITEEVYQDLYREADGAKSVHLSNFPRPTPRDPAARATGEWAKEITAAVRRWKSDKGMSLNGPLGSVKVITSTIDGGEAVEDIRAALNASELSVVGQDPTLHEEAVSLRPIHARIGPRFRASAKEVLGLISEADPAETAGQLQGEGWHIKLRNGSEATLTLEDIEIERGWVSEGKSVDAVQVGESVVVLPIPD
jgi:valyl-tRNA synthetase